MRFSLLILPMLACSDGVTDTGPTPDGDIEVNPTTVDFGLVFIGGAEETELAITNQGKQDTDLLLSIMGGAASDYAIAPHVSSPAKGETASHTLTFTPTQWGNRSVSVLVEDSVSGESVEVLVSSTVQVDSDGDGFGDLSSGGEDCDDTNADVNPDATEVCEDGLDNDCEGGDQPCEHTGWEDVALADISTVGAGTVGHGYGSALEIGDITGDGIADLIVGAPTDSTGASSAGTARIYPGPINDLSTASAYVVSTDSADGAVGACVTMVGDYNGDGQMDLGIGAPHDNTIRTNQGRALIILGPINGDLDALDADARLYGDTRKDYAGKVIAPAGDLDGDGNDDVLIGAPELSDGRLGRVFLLPGNSVSGWKDLGDMDNTIYGDGGFARVGDLVLSGDFDADGIPDSVVGGSDLMTEAGAVSLFIINDGPSGDVSISDADAQFNGHLQLLLEHGTVDSGDIDDDGYDDLLVGAPSLLAPSTNYGRMCVIPGPFGANMDLTDASGCLDGTTSGQRLGSRVAILGDFAGNGGVDLVTADAQGVLHLVYGTLTGIHTEADQRMTPPESASRVGQALVGGGDVNADGRNDLAVGAPGYTSDAGQVFLVTEVF